MNRHCGGRNRRRGTNVNLCWSIMEAMTRRDNQTRNNVAPPPAAPEIHVCSKESDALFFLKSSKKRGTQITPFFEFLTGHKPSCHLRGPPEAAAIAISPRSRGCRTPLGRRRKGLSLFRCRLPGGEEAPGGPKKAAGKWAMPPSLIELL